MQRDPVTHHITTRLCRIQERHNFNPNRGARQIANVQDRGVRDAYKEFATLLAVVKKGGLVIDLPYDPSGLNPLGHLHERAARTKNLYFARTLTTREWKVGVSYDPYKRCAQLQTGNGNHLEVLYTIKGDHKLETLVLRYLRMYRSRGRGGREWLFDLPDAVARSLIGRIQDEGREFLVGGPRLGGPPQEPIK